MAVKSLDAAKSALTNGTSIVILPEGQRLLRLPIPGMWILCFKNRLTRNLSNIIEELTMSVFEAVMLLCFGLAWPFSIYKSWKTGTNGSKSILFLSALLVGYLSGILHKILYNMDGVIYLYIINASMVTIDMLLFIRNNKREGENTGETN